MILKEKHKDDRTPRSVNNFNHPLGLKRNIIDSFMEKAKKKLRKIQIKS